MKPVFGAGPAASLRGPTLRTQETSIRPSEVTIGTLAKGLLLRVHRESQPVFRGFVRRVARLQRNFDDPLTTTGNGDVLICT
jgi:hypothetical protein